MLGPGAAPAAPTWDGSREPRPSATFRTRMPRWRGGKGRGRSRRKGRGKEREKARGNENERTKGQETIIAWVWVWRREIGTLGPASFGSRRVDGSRRNPSLADGRSLENITRGDASARTVMQSVGFGADVARYGVFFPSRFNGRVMSESDGF